MDYDIGLDSCSEFSLPDSSMDKNLIVFGVDMSSSVHIDNKGKDIVIIGPTKLLNDTSLTTGAYYLINFSK